MFKDKLYRLMVYHYRPGQVLWTLRNFRLPELLDVRHMKVVRSAPGTGHLYLPGIEYRAIVWPEGLSQ